MTTKDITAVGRRKCAVARVRLREEKGAKAGQILINGLPIDDQRNFPLESDRKLIKSPLGVLANPDTFDGHSIVVTVDGGGTSGRRDAILLGIARCVVEYSPESRRFLKGTEPKDDETGSIDEINSKFAQCNPHFTNLLTRDSREKERKKYGQPGARKKFQFSKR